jgi:hypothetical protein
LGPPARDATLRRTHPHGRLLRPPPRFLPEVPLALHPVVRLSLAAALLALVHGAALAAPPARSKAPAAAPQGELTILYGDDHALGIVPPAGWTVDDTSGLGSRIRVVLYPIGQTWSTAPTVMYVNPLHQQARTPRSLRQMIDHDVAEFLKKSPGGRVTARAPLRTAKDLAAEVRYFAPKGGEPQEAVAYVPEEDLVMLLVLSSRDAADFKRYLPAFESLVSGYQFVAGGIQTPR